MPNQKCHIVLLYNIHQSVTSWNFISKVLSDAKKQKYSKLVVEASHKKKFKDTQKLATAIKNNPELIKMTLDSLTGNDKKGNSLKSTVLSVVDTESKSFPTLIKILNDQVSMNPGTEQFISLDDGTKITFPTTLDRIKKLPEHNKDEAMLYLKEAALLVVEHNYKSGANFGSVSLEALLGGFELLGMDVAKECKQSDIKCRDQFMAKKLHNDICTPGSKIIATVGLSHGGLGALLKKYEDISLKEYYPFDPRITSDSDIHNSLIYGSAQSSIKVIDVTDSVDIAGLLEISGHSEL